MEFAGLTGTGVVGCRMIRRRRVSCGVFPGDRGLACANWMPIPSEKFRAQREILSPVNAELGTNGQAAPFPSIAQQDHRSHKMVAGGSVEAYVGRHVAVATLPTCRLNGRSHDAGVKIIIMACCRLMRVLENKGVEEKEMNDDSQREK